MASREGRGLLDDQLSFDHDYSNGHELTPVGSREPSLSEDDIMSALPNNTPAPNGHAGLGRRTSFNLYGRHREAAAAAAADIDIPPEWEGVIGRSKYDDFTTIDWVRDASLERKRQAQLAGKMRSSWSGWATKVLGDAWQGWLAVCLVGMLSGLFAAIIAIGSEWLSDLKVGLCPSAPWLNQKFCCWTQREEHCPDWKTWSELIGPDSITDAYVVAMAAYTLVAVILAVYCSLLVLRFAPYAAGSGIPEVKTILSGFVIHKFLGLCTLIIKTLGLVLSVSAGLSLGKEGPLVHVACCVGNVVSRLFPKYRNNEAKKREIMSAACAAGVSVAFGAPIGGVLFSLEEVSYYFPHKTMWRSFFCALTAASTLQYLDPFRTGRLVMFYITYDSPWHLFELPCFVLLGILGGLYGAFFARANVSWCAFKRRTFLASWPVAEVAAVALVTALCRYPIPLLRISSGAMIHELFSECLPNTTTQLCQEQTIGYWMLLLLGSALITAVITVFTFGIKVPAGLFVPSMAIGALIGRALGILADNWVEQHLSVGFIASSCYTGKVCVTPGLYAVVGAAAFLGGVTRMTVSLVVIIFELTGGLVYIIPVMVAVLVSKWVGDATGTEGIYDEHIRLRGYPYLDAKTSYTKNRKAATVMRPRQGDPPLCVLTVNGNTLQSLCSLLEDTGYKGYPVIGNTDTRNVVGYVHRNELQACLDMVSSSGLPGDTRCFFTAAPASRSVGFVDLRRCVDVAPLSVTVDTPIEIVVDLFRKLGLRYLLVTSGGELVGLITKKDILEHLESVSPHVI